MKKERFLSFWKVQAKTHCYKLRRSLKFNNCKYDILDKIGTFVILNSIEHNSYNSLFMRQLLILSILSSIVLLSACTGEKNQTEDEIVDIVGFWEGTYTTDGRPDLEPQYYNLLIKSDGTLTNEGSWFSSTRINIGTWELKENILKFHVSNVMGGEGPNPQIGTATFDKRGKLVDGVIQNLSGSTSSRFELVKRK